MTRREACLLAAALAAPARGAGRRVLGGHGMAACADPLAVRAAESVLDLGGNAIEAAVAAAAALGVVEPYASGIGGGGFFLAWLAEARAAFCLDSRVMAPETFSDGDVMGVPGAVLLWEEALRTSRDLAGGTMTLAGALEPAIAFAEGGFEINETFLATLGRHAARLRRFPESARLFLEPGWSAGDTFRQPALGRTLRLVAAEGAGAFYHGPIAEALARHTPMRKTDLAAYEVKLREPVEGSYRGWRLIGAPPPASGAFVMEMLNLLEGFPIGAPGYRSMEANTAHLLIECMKLAYADRFAYLGDPDFVPVPTRGLTDKEYAGERRKLIELDRALRLPVRRGEPVREDGCTTHISVIDRRGNCVAYTNTLSTLFGSAFVLPEYGFLLNDSLDDFDANGTGPNKAEPWKRPKSAMSPMFVLGGEARPRLVLGAAGGNRIPGILFPILSSVLDQNRTVEQALADPRFVNENRTLTASARDTQREPAPYNMAQSLIGALTARGQVVHRNALPFGAAQAVEADPETGELRRGTDPRRGGDF